MKTYNMEVKTTQQRVNGENISRRDFSRDVAERIYSVVERTKVEPK